MGGTRNALGTVVVNIKGCKLNKLTTFKPTEKEYTFEPYNNEKKIGI
jgi:hypothetical protein